MSTPKCSSSNGESRAVWKSSNRRKWTKSAAEPPTKTACMGTAGSSDTCQDSQPILRRCEHTSITDNRKYSGRNYLNQGKRCPKCTEVVPVSQVAVHDCGYKRCTFCSEYFPEFLLSDHAQACPRNTGRARQSPANIFYGGAGVQDAPRRESAGQRSTSTMGRGGVRIGGADRPPQERGHSVRIVTLEQRPDGRVLAREQVFGIPHNLNLQRGVQQERGNPTRSPVPAGLAEFGFPFGMPMSRGAPGRAAHPLQSLLSAFFGVGFDDPSPSMGLMMGGPQPSRPGTNQSRRLDPNEEFAQHSQFVRSNRNQLRDLDFLNQFLAAIDSRMAMGGGHFVILGDQPADEPNRMNKDEVKQLKVTKYKKATTKSKEGDEQCPICCEELKNGDDVKVLPCKHTFHPGCIDTWLIKNCTCPICKRDVKDLLEGAPTPAQNLSSPSRRRP